MNKTNIQRLLHTLLPFIIMTMVQRSLLLIFGHLELTGEIAELLAFLPAAVCAALIFRIKTYTVEDGDGHTDTPPLEPKPAWICILHTLVACGVMIILMYVVAALIGSGTSDVPEVSVTAVLSTLLVHPVVEELLFRRMFYGELRLLHPFFGCLAQSMMFAIVHNTVDGMLYALCSGVVLAVLYENSGRIWTAVAAHIVVNLRSYLCLTVLASRPDLAQAVDVAFGALGLAAFVWLAVLEGRKFAAYQEPDGGTAETAASDSSSSEGENDA